MPARQHRALDQLVLRWHPRLLRYAQFHVGSPETADDVVQDTWIAVVHGIGGLADPSAFQAWAYRIVTNKCRDWQRRRRMERSVFAESAQQALENAASRPAAGSMEAEALENALSTLDADDRTLVRLYYFEELTVSQVADVFGIPAGTVKSRLHRCRETLRKQLEETNRE
ncbi:MAG: RNA polymerase sigma factor [Candidatus Hydrogenedentes bacterium]|nr:RNA polymerase sigma factor [Candidatus Hydrogenedentota bacterium]